MSLTGVIYGGIVVLWLCYLVPLALRRYDDATRARSVERFSDAMRGLGRADAVDPPVRTPVAWVDPRAQQGAARIAARRRRRVLGVLGFGAAATAVVCFVGLAPWWAMSIAAGLVVAFLVVARVQVARTRTRTWESALVAGEVAPMGDPPGKQPTVVLDAVAEQVHLPQQVVAAAVPTEGGAALWDPVPVTLPTYVFKPAAPRRASPQAMMHSSSPSDRDASSPAGEPAEQAQAEQAPARAVGD